MPTPALIRVVARIHGGPTNKTVTLYKGYTQNAGGTKVYDGDPRYHLAIALRPFRTSFSDLERIIDDVGSGSDPECYAAAREEVRATLPGVFTLGPTDVLPAHYWNGERWVKIAPGDPGFAHGYLIWKDGSPYTEIVSVGPGPDPAHLVYLEMDFVVSVQDTSLYP